MKKTILVAGKDMPECSDLSDSLIKNERNVIVSGAEDTPADKPSDNDNMLFSNEEISKDFQTGIHQSKWNRSSSLSTRSFALQCENVFGSIDEAFIYFDEEYFASLQEKMDVEEVSKSSDFMITSYQNLVLEIISRFEKAENQMHNLVFFVNQCPTLSDAVKNPVLRNGSNILASPLVASACSSFISFAENIAALYGFSKHQHHSCKKRFNQRFSI